MRNMNKMAAVLLAAFILVTGLGLGACNNNNKNPEISSPPPVAPVKLSLLANLQVERATLTWNAVANASGYRVRINGTEIQNNVPTPKYHLLALIAPGNTYEIEVMAKGNGTSYTDSDWSAAFTHTVPVPDVLYALPADDDPADHLAYLADPGIEIYNETGLKLGVLTKDVLAFIDQEAVADNATRHYIAYSMTEILAYLDISAEFESAYLEASDVPDEYNTTVTNFDAAYIAIVRLTTDTGAVESTSKFPRFIAGDGLVEGDAVLSNVGTITLGGIAPNPSDPTNPTNPTDPTNPIGGLEDLAIEIYSQAGAKLGVITKDALTSLTQVIVPYTDGGGERDYYSYRLTDILAVLGISTTGFNYAYGEADDYDVTGELDDSYVVVLRIDLSGNETPGPFFLAPNTGKRGYKGSSSASSLACRGVKKITLEK